MVFVFNCELPHVVAVAGASSLPQFFRGIAILQHTLTQMVKHSHSTQFHFSYYDLYAAQNPKSHNRHKQIEIMCYCRRCRHTNLLQNNRTLLFTIVNGCALSRSRYYYSAMHGYLSEARLYNNARGLPLSYTLTHN